MFNKLFLSIALIGASFSAFAANELTITPGSSVLLKPNEETKVICTGAEEKLRCICQYGVPPGYTTSLYYFPVVLLGGGKTLVVGGAFGTAAACGEAIKANPSCN